MVKKTGEQDPAQAPPAGASSGSDGTPPPAEQPLIPKKRFDEVNTRARAAEQRVAELERQLAAARQGDDDATDGLEPPASPPPTAPTRTLLRHPDHDGDALSRTERLLNLRLDRGITREAAELVLSYTDKGMTPDEAFDFAASRRPALFGREERVGHDASQHHVSPPASGPSSTPAEPEPTRLQKVQAIRGLHERSKAAMAGAVDIVKDQIKKNWK